MLRIRQLWALALMAIFVPALANAQFKAGDWELTLGANAAHGPDLDGVSGGGTGSIGYFFTPNIELSARQTINYTDINVSGGQLTGITLIPLDYHFDLGRWQPFLGVNLGFIYGDIHNTFEAGPEAGVKWFANDTTFIYGLVTYDYPFDKGSDKDAFSNGMFAYTVGIGFRF